MKNWMQLVLGAKASPLVTLRVYPTLTISPVGVSGLVVRIMETMREHPELLGKSLTSFPRLYHTYHLRLDLSLFTLECINYSGCHKYPLSPTSPPLSEATSYLSALTVASGATPAASYIFSDLERTTYYRGISLDPPELLYRSDLLKNPFSIPKGRFARLPTKTVYGVFNTPLNAVWDTVAPQIRDTLKARNVCYSAIKAARFLTHGGEDGEDTLGPVVIWIATHPTTTTAKNAHDASPDILALLKANGVEGAVVEWYEGAVEKLSGPHLLRVTSDTNPTYYVRRFLTAALGMPIAIAEKEATDAQGSIALFFHENKDKHGAPSAKVFGVTNCHLLRENTTINYELKAGAPHQHVRLAGFHRFQRGLDEIKDCVYDHGIHADLLVREIVDLEMELKSEDPEGAEQNEVPLKAKWKKLAEVKEDIGALEAFYKDTNQWYDIARRNIGHIDWAPKISVDVQGYKYTRDIGTFEVDARKFKAQFKGNIVDLGAFCLIFLIFTSSDRNNLQDPSLLPGNSPACSTLKVAVGRRSSSPHFASSGSMVVSRANSWLFPTVSTATATPALSS